MKPTRAPPLGAAASALMADQSNTFDRMVVHGYDASRYPGLKVSDEPERQHMLDFFTAFAAPGKFDMRRADGIKALLRNEPVPSARQREGEVRATRRAFQEQRREAARASSPAEKQQARSERRAPSFPVAPERAFQDARAPSSSRRPGSRVSFYSESEASGTPTFHTESFVTDYAESEPARSHVSAAVSKDECEKLRSQINRMGKRTGYRCRAGRDATVAELREEYDELLKSLECDEYVHMYWESGLTAAQLLELANHYTGHFLEIDNLDDAMQERGVDWLRPDLERIYHEYHWRAGTRPPLESLVRKVGLFVLRYHSSNKKSKVTGRRRMRSTGSTLGLGSQINAVLSAPSEVQEEEDDYSLPSDDESEFSDESEPESEPRRPHVASAVERSEPRRQHAATPAVARERPVIAPRRSRVQFEDDDDTESQESSELEPPRAESAPRTRVMPSVDLQPHNSVSAVLRRPKTFREPSSVAPEARVQPPSVVSLTGSAPTFGAPVRMTMRRDL